MLMKHFFYLPAEKTFLIDHSKDILKINRAPTHAESLLKDLDDFNES